MLARFDMVTYDLLYRGGGAASLRDQVSRWCEDHDCELEIISLTAGWRFRIIGEQQMVRQAVGMIRQWIRVAA